MPFAPLCRMGDRQWKSNLTEKVSSLVTIASAKQTPWMHKWDEAESLS